MVKMNKLKIYKVDAFTDTVFAGNPAAVCILNHWLPSSLMQNIAAENNLAETAFLVKEQNKYHIRWFTPKVEVDLCGHATLAAAHILFSFDFEDGTVIQFFSERSGELTVSKENALYTLDFPADLLVEIGLTDELKECFDKKPIQAYKGKTDYIFVFEDEESIKTLTVDFNLLSKIDCRGVCVTAKGSVVDFVSRFFAPQSGINEDPVTGSAHTSLIPIWSDKLQKQKMQAMQLSERGGYLVVENKGERVKISGNAVTYLVGEIFF